MSEHLVIHDPTRQCFFLAFDLRSADSIDDARIEALVQKLAGFTADQAKTEGMPYEESVMAVLEFCARWIAGGMKPPRPGDDRDAKLAATLMMTLKGRILIALEGIPPGDEGHRPPQ